MNEEESLRALESKIARKLGSNVQPSDYPEEARRQGWSGTTLVGVVVAADRQDKLVTFFGPTGNGSNYFGVAPLIEHTRCQARLVGQLLGTGLNANFSFLIR